MYVWAVILPSQRAYLHLQSPARCGSCGRGGCLGAVPPCPLRTSKAQSMRPPPQPAFCSVSQSTSCCSLSDTSLPVRMAEMPSTAPMAEKALRRGR